MPATVWKVLTKNSPGTSSTFAADDWDMPGRYMHDVDFSATDPSSIKTNTSYWDNRLRIWNPAKTKSYRLRALAILNDYDLTLPLLTSNDEIVGLITSQTLQNKTFNINNNTLKHGSTNAIGDLLVGTGTKYDRLAMGATAGHVLSIKSDLSGLEWAAAAGGGGGSGEVNTASNVGTAGVGVFKLKSGVNLQFKKINAASGGLIAVTDDTSNSEVDLALTGGTDGQFLKTVGTTPTWSNLSGSSITMPDGTAYSGVRYGALMGGATDGWGVFGGLYNEGTITSEVGSTVSRTRYTTAAVDQAIAGFSTWSAMTRRQHNPRFKIRFSTSTSTERVYVGFIANDTFPGGSLVLASETGAVMGYNEGDTNFLARWNNGTVGEQTTATSVAKNTALHNVEIFLNDTGGSVSMWFDGTLVVNASTTQAPAQTTGLAVHAWAQAVGATATAIEVEYAQLTFG